MPLPFNRHVSIWTDNDLKFIDPQDPHQIHISYRVLNHVIDLKQENIDDATGIKTSLALAPQTITNERRLPTSQ